MDDHDDHDDDDDDDDDDVSEDEISIDPLSPATKLLSLGCSLLFCLWKQPDSKQAQVKGQSVVMTLSLYTTLMDPAKAPLVRSGMAWD